MQSLAQSGYEVAKVNLLLSIATDEDTLLSEKYKSTAIIEYLRSNEKIPEAGNLKSKEPGSHMIPKEILES